MVGNKGGSHGGKVKENGLKVEVVVTRDIALDLQGTIAFKWCD